MVADLLGGLLVVDAGLHADDRDKRQEGSVDGGLHVLSGSFKERGTAG